MAKSPFLNTKKEFNEKMNVLMILSNPFMHDPRVYNEAKSLIKAGHKVTVLARDRKKEYPSREVKDGISIRRVYNTRFISALPYNFFDLYFWWIEGYKKALELHSETGFDAVHCHNFDTLPIGVKIKRKLNIPLIYDAHEIWGYMVSKDMPWWKYYLFREKHIIKYADKIIIAEDKYDDYFNSITNKKLTSLLNCKHLISREYIAPNNKKFTLLYIGALSSARFLLELTEVVKDIDGVKCIIGGIGNPAYVEKLKHGCNKTDNVKFIGKVPREKVIPMTQKSDVVVHMITAKNVNNRIATANKQFEAMVCGRPIISTKNTRVGEITIEENCGLVIDRTKEALLDAIIKLRNSPGLCKKLGENAFRAAKEKYNWSREERKLIKIYNDLKKDSNIKLAEEGRN